VQTLLSPYDVLCSQIDLKTSGRLGQPNPRFYDAGPCGVRHEYEARHDVIPVLKSTGLEHLLLACRESNSEK